jgi:hypothetical protein
VENNSVQKRRDSSAIIKIPSLLQVTRFGKLLELTPLASLLGYRIAPCSWWHDLKANSKARK